MLTNISSIAMDIKRFTLLDILFYSLFKKNQARNFFFTKNQVFLIFFASFYSAKKKHFRLSEQQFSQFVFTNPTHILIIANNLVLQNIINCNCYCNVIDINFRRSFHFLNEQKIQQKNNGKENN